MEVSTLCFFAQSLPQETLRVGKKKNLVEICNK